MDRRQFLKTLGAVGVLAAVPGVVLATGEQLTMLTIDGVAIYDAEIHPPITIGSDLNMVKPFPDFDLSVIRGRWFAVEIITSKKIVGYQAIFHGEPGNEHASMDDLYISVPMESADAKRTGEITFSIGDDSITFGKPDDQ